MPSLTVVVPVLNEAVLLDPFLRKTKEDLETGGIDWELILVNDGSTDKSLEIMRRFAATDARVTVIDLGFNHGPGANLHQAFQQATKEFCCYATVDGFYDTRLLPKLLERLESSHAVSPRANDVEHISATPAFYGSVYSLPYAADSPYGFLTESPLGIAHAISVLGNALQSIATRIPRQGGCYPVPPPKSR